MEPLAAFTSHSGAEDAALSLERRPNPRKKVAWLVFGISLDAENIPDRKKNCNGNDFTAFSL